MKSLKEILEASILNTEETLADNKTATHKVIKDFLFKTYDFNEMRLYISDEPNADGKYEVSCDDNVAVIDKSIDRKSVV